MPSDSLNQRTALVTGAYGFVGRHVARSLAASGYAVTGLGHGSWGSEEWRRWGLREWHGADVNVDTLVTYAGDPDLVFHCAGSGSVAFSVSHPYQDYQRTVATTLSVLEYLRLHKPSARLVIPSSAGVYGLVERMPIAIDTPLRPVSPYGLHKRIAEDLCGSYTRHFGVQAAIVRLFSVYGIGLRKQLLWDACIRLSGGITRFDGTGAETRDWLHVEDAAALLIEAAAHASVDCPIVNGGCSTATEIREVVALLADALGAAPPAFSGRQRPGDPAHYLADTAGARGWGWAPKRSLQDELRAYAAWFRSGAA